MIAHEIHSRTQIMTEKKETVKWIQLNVVVCEKCREGRRCVLSRFLWEIVWSTNPLTADRTGLRGYWFSTAHQVLTCQSPSAVTFPHLAMCFHGCQRCHVYDIGFSVFISYFLPSRVRIFCCIGSLNRFFSVIFHRKY